MTDKDKMMNFLRTKCSGDEVEEFKEIWEAENPHREKRQYFDDFTEEEATIMMGILRDYKNQRIPVQGIRASDWKNIRLD